MIYEETNDATIDTYLRQPTAAPPPIAPCIAVPAARS